MEFLWKALLVTSWLAAFLAVSQADDPGEERNLQVRSTTVEAAVCIECLGVKIREQLILTKMCSLREGMCHRQQT